MPSLIEQVHGKTNEPYMCLEISHEHSQEDTSKALSAFKKTQITALDIHFSKAVKAAPEKIKNILASLVLLSDSSVNYLDLSCASLYQLGISGFESLLKSLPANIKTLVLSGNEWDKLGLDAITLAKKIHPLTTATVLFEGTDEFEHQLTAQLVLEVKQAPTNNRYRMFSEEGQTSQLTEKKGPSCVIC